MNVRSPQLKIDLRPLEDENRSTTCIIAIRIDDEAIWPVRGELEAGLEGQIDDLLSYLTEFWKPLMLRQVYPIDVSPIRPSDLRREAERRWAELRPAAVAKEAMDVSAFEEAHDLSRAFAGLFGLPCFWLLRSGDKMVVDTQGQILSLAFQGVRRSLSALGDEICERLAKVDLHRWADSIEAWRDRDKADGAVLLAWSAGLDVTVARTLIEEGALSGPHDFEEATNDNDELRIAARMAGALPAGQIRDIIVLAKQFESRPAEALAGLADASSTYVETRFAGQRPFAQGEAAALFVREQLGITDNAKVDIFAVAAKLGLDVRSAGAEPDSLIGLAIWGARHGPGVFLNEFNGRILPQSGSVYDSAGARVTLAHELCHLLLDGRHALSAIEVLRARMPVGVEQRAKSFAGEFLLPSHVAAGIWITAGAPTGRADVEAVVLDLTERFRVTRSVAAWKLEHGAALQDTDLAAVLNAVAPHR